MSKVVSQHQLIEAAEIFRALVSNVNEENKHVFYWSAATLLDYYPFELTRETLLQLSSFRTDTEEGLRALKRFLFEKGLEQLAEKVKNLRSEEEWIAFLYQLEEQRQAMEQGVSGLLH
ncbi:hypothetical protein [Calditerricola satsumensis]|uniref:Uncharacterized protein n=1 Tax=Calditerricola satsumensis TaxID=373054 RepID=A0A8J3FAV1_9BACI|nr:hypothetical protein [Calditerricola satsumensis]GGJ99132.1 hypothetical protein GCM10007043_11500 [Calditerricola satsumensis]